MMALYMSKPSTIEAIRWTGQNISEVFDFAEDKVKITATGLHLLAGTGGAQGWVPVPYRHWLVCQPGDKGDIWPVDPDYFDAKYEPSLPVGEVVQNLRDRLVANTTCPHGLHFNGHYCDDCHPSGRVQEGPPTERGTDRAE